MTAPVSGGNLASAPVWWKLKTSRVLLFVIFLLVLALVASILAFVFKADLVKPELSSEGMKLSS